MTNIDSVKLDALIKNKLEISFDRKRLSIIQDFKKIFNKTHNIENYTLIVYNEIISLDAFMLHTLESVLEEQGIIENAQTNEIDIIRTNKEFILQYYLPLFKEYREILINEIKNYHKGFSDYNYTKFIQKLDDLLQQDVV